MRKSKRMEPVSRVMHSREDKATRALQQAQGAMMLQKQRLEQLGQYREEYLKRFEDECRKGMSMAQVQDYQAFMQSLGTAIARQGEALQKYIADYEAKKRQWLAAHQRSEALDGVVERYQQQEQRVEEKKLQKETDDRSAHGAAKRDDDHGKH